MCDKGEGEKRRDNSSFVNLVSRFDKKKDRDKDTCIGIHSPGSFSTDTSHGFDHALIWYDSDNNRVILYGQGTDSCGDGR